MEAIAAQIRALIHANAPGLDRTAQQLPDAALIGVPAGAALLVLILLLALIGAAAGGGKKRKRAAEADRGDEEDDIPRPAPVRAPAAPPPPADRRADTILEMVAKARAPNAEHVGAEQRAAQERAIAHVLKASPAAAKAFAGGDLHAAFEKLAADARDSSAAGKSAAPDLWRALGTLADGVDDATALDAFDRAFKVDPTDFWSDVFYARLLARAGRRDDALSAAEAAASHAKGPREKAIAQAELGDANLHLDREAPARTAYQSAIEALRMLARSGERRAQADLSVGLSKLADLETAAGKLDAAMPLYEEDLTISRHLASANPSPTALRNVLISLVKLAAISKKQQRWIEARDYAEQLSRAGNLAESDRPLLEGLRKEAQGAS